MNCLDPLPDLDNANVGICNLTYFVPVLPGYVERMYRSWYVRSFLCRLQAKASSGRSRTSEALAPAHHRKSEGLEMTGVTESSRG